MGIGNLKKAKMRPLQSNCNPARLVAAASVLVFHSAVLADADALAG